MRHRLLRSLALPLLMFSCAGPAAAQAQDANCDPDLTRPCAVTQTGLWYRVLVKPGTTVFADMDENSASVGSQPAPFSVYNVFSLHDVTYDADNFAAAGWFRIGAGLKEPDGFVRAEDVVPWRQALALAYTNPGPSERKPVLMFRNLSSLETELQAAANGPDAPEAIYTAVAAGSPPESVISREANSWVDINKTFYLLPILDFQSMEAYVPDVMGLQLAALTNQARAQQQQACDLHASGAQTCIAGQSGGPAGPLALDVVFVMDTTLSMQPYIDAVTRAVRETAQTLGQKAGNVQMRFGIVGYRDSLEHNPDLEYEAKNFTPELLDASAFQQLLDTGVVHASPSGSGDWEEEVFAGMQEATKSAWSDKAARIIILIGDASSHPVGHAKNTTGLSEIAVRQLATEQKIYVSSIYINGLPADLADARAQFEGMAAGASEGAPAFAIVEPGSGGSVEGGASLELSLREALANIADFMSSGSFDSIVSGGTDADDQTGQAVLGAVRAAFVDYLGSEATPPSNIVAWVPDRDLTALEKRSFDVKVMVDRNSLQTLQQFLEAVLSKFQVGQTTSVGFLQQVQTASTGTSFDLQISDAEQFINSPVIPMWIKALPYKSAVLTLSPEEFRAASADDRSRFESRLTTLIAFYKDVENRPESWVLLHENAPPEDKVFMLDLQYLP